MHLGNRDFLTDMANKHPEHFSNAKVLELGSLDLNGSARDHFTDCDYTGIDRIAGPCVDILVDARHTSFKPESFDTIVCMSMFEHDADWRISFSHNLQWLRPGGMLILCWGAEGNLHHNPEPWKPVLSSEMAEFVATLPLVDVDMFFEGDRYTADCPGAWDMIAFKKSRD